jgi:ElaB/YqjD/DUF883 family membrane-anchored ribosome-binding protein
LKLRNEEMKRTYQQKEELLRKYEEDESMLNSATKNAEAKLNGLVAQLKNAIGEDRYIRWNESRGVVTRSKPSVPTSLENVSSSVLALC